MTDTENKPVKRGVYVVLFAYTGEAHCPVKDMCFQALGKMAQKGWGATMFNLMGDGMLPRARNKAVNVFLQSGMSDLVMIDDDNFCSPDGLVRLLEHDVDCIGAACRSRTDPLKWPIRWKHNGEIRRSSNGLINVETVGTGIFRITRKCIEQMIAAHPERWFTADDLPGQKVYSLFEYEMDEAHHQFWGEDVTFCRRYNAAGGEVWIDPDIETHHIGLMDFSASVTAWLQVMPPQIRLISAEIDKVSMLNNTLSAQPTQPTQPEKPEEAAACALSSASEVDKVSMLNNTLSAQPEKPEKPEEAAA